MALLSCAASHHDLELSALERLSTDWAGVSPELVAAAGPVRGAVVLATCNRFELYLDVDDERLAEACAAASEAVAARSGLAPATVRGHLRHRTEAEAAQHLFAVAAGLDSMVVGEREIAGQVRRALTHARREGTTTSVLEQLFQRASRVSRAVEAATGLGGTGRSVVGVALDLASGTLRRHVPDGAAAGDEHVDWSGLRVVLVGTGSYAGASLAALRSRGCRDVRVWSASGRAAAFAAARGAHVADPDLLSELAHADLVVACSGTGGPVLHGSALAAVRSAAGNAEPLTVVDLALRHDVDPSVGALPQVHLVSLHSVAAHAPAGSVAVTESTEMVAAAAAEFVAERRVRAWDPAVVAERTRVLTATEDDQAARRRARAALHGPTVRAREAARRGDVDAYRQALAELAAVHPVVGDSIA
ncbi:MAG: glutamyl-tRNA reductase [Cellulomonas sp. 14-74-6]|nr:MAG: glutamyl-tRNA reductase [Cellulomonas sp. 14-74-6]